MPLLARGGSLSCKSHMPALLRVASGTVTHLSWGEAISCSREENQAGIVAAARPFPAPELPSHAEGLVLLSSGWGICSLGRTHFARKGFQHRQMVSQPCLPSDIEHPPLSMCRVSSRPPPPVLPGKQSRACRVIQAVSGNLETWPGIIGQPPTGPGQPWRKQSVTANLSTSGLSVGGVGGG